VARIEQRGRGRDVLARQPGRRARLAHRVPDRELLVPQRIQQAIAHLLGERLVAVVQHDEVDVGVRGELAARPAAGRDQRELGAPGRRGEPLGELPVVDLGDRAARRGALAGLAQRLGQRRERRVEQRAQARGRRG